MGHRFGGRAKGTPNKATSTVRATIGKIIEDYFNSELFEKDLEKLSPKARVEVMEKFAAYTVPKLQATTLEATVEAKKTIEDKLAALAGEEE